jgi:PKD repeat protein
VVGWSWSFGDGTTGSGSSVSHTYAADGAYSVSLVVTDNGGLTDDVVHGVSVSGSDPPPVTEFVVDDFDRTVANGWGSAPTGGAYTRLNTSSRYAVSGGVGRLLLTGASQTAELIMSQAVGTDVDLRATVTSTVAGGSFGSTIGFVLRHQSQGNDYRGRVRFAPNGTVVASVVRRTGAVADEYVGSAVTVPGLSNSSSVELRVTATGTNPTTITVTAWATGTPEPATPQVVVTDSTPALQQAGAVGVTGYVGGGSTNGATITVDAFRARTPS